MATNTKIADGLTARLISQAKDYYVLTKPEVNLLILMTTSAGYYLGLHGRFHVAGMIHTLVGTLLVASGTATPSEADRNAVRPVAFERVRTKLTPDELDEEDRGIYERMLETYERGGASGLETELAEYPAEEQDLIRRAWAAPPPSVDDEVAVELAERIRLDHMKGLHSGIIRELSEAERGKDSERVARLEAQARELAHAIDEMERRG